MLLTGPPLLKGALNNMKLAWQELDPLWRDSVRQEFEDRHLEPLESKIGVALGEMALLAELFAKVEKECK